MGMREWVFSDLEKYIQLTFYRQNQITRFGGKTDGTPLYSLNHLPDLVICGIVLKLM